MSNRERGLYGKFFIHRVDGRDAAGGDKAGADYFVLDLTHDKFAWPALMAYMEACRDEYPLLFADLQKKALAKMGADAVAAPQPPDPVKALAFRIPREKYGQDWLRDDVWSEWMDCDQANCWLAYVPDAGWVLIQGDNPPKIIWWEKGQ